MSYGYREVQQEVFEGASGEISVIRTERFGRMMADASVAAAYEEHAHIGDSGHDHRVMAGSTRESSHFGIAGDTRDAVSPQLLHLGRTGDASDIQHLAPLNFDIPAGGDPLRFGHHCGERCVSHLVAGSADVNTQLAASGNHIH